LKPASVRPVSYGVVAAMALAAIWFVPTLEKKSVFVLEPVTVTRAGLEPADFELRPLLIQASNTELIDTLAIAGVIRSSLYNALNESGVGVLPPSARHKLAWSLADIFEYRVDMSRDLSKGDKFHVLVERLQKPNGAIIVNKVLRARTRRQERARSNRLRHESRRYQVFRRQRQIAAGRISPGSGRVPPHQQHVWQPPPPDLRHLA
jgi:hypothetical protein